jgi:hypothetical protein
MWVCGEAGDQPADVVAMRRIPVVFGDLLSSGPRLAI